MTVLVHDPPSDLEASNHIINPISPAMRSPSNGSTNSMESSSSSGDNMGALVHNKDRRTSLASDVDHHAVSLISSSGSDEYVFVART